MTKPVLASCSDTIKWWEVPNLTATKEFNPHQKPVTSLCWSANNQLLVSGSSDGSVSVSLRGVPVVTLEGSGMGPINSVTCTSSGKLVAAGDTNGSVHVWEAKTRNLLKSFKVNQLSQDSQVTRVQFNSSDTHIAAGSDTGDIVLYSMTTNQIVANFQISGSEESGVRDLKYSPFLRHILAACSDDGGIHMWDTHARKLFTTFPQQHNAPASAIAFSPTNKLLLASCGLDKKILFYDINDKKQLKVIHTDSPLNCISFMEDGVTLAAGSTLGKIFVYDLRKGSTPFCTLTAHEPFAIKDIQFHRPRSDALVAAQGPPSAPSVISPSTPSVISPSNPFVVPTPIPSVIPAPYIATPSSVSTPGVINAESSTIASITTGTNKPSVPLYTSDFALYSPIKGQKGGSTPLQPQTRDEQHRELMAKAQRILQQSVPKMPSGLSTNKVQQASEAYSGINTNYIINDVPHHPTPQTPHTASPIYSTLNTPLHNTTDSPNLSATGPRASSTPNIINRTTSNVHLQQSPIAFSSHESPIEHLTSSIELASPAVENPPFPVFGSHPDPAKPSHTVLNITPPSSPTPSSPTDLHAVATPHYPTPKVATSNTPTSAVVTQHSTHIGIPRHDGAEVHTGSASSVFRAPASPPAISSPPPTLASSPPPILAPPHGTPILPIQDVQWHLLKSALDDSMEQLKDTLHQDIQNVHVEVIRQTVEVQEDIRAMRDVLEQYALSQKELVEEIKALRRENALLRQRVFY